MPSTYSFKNRLAKNQESLGGERPTILNSLAPPSPLDGLPTPDLKKLPEKEKEEKPEVRAPEDVAFYESLPKSSQDAVRFHNIIKPIVTKGLPEEQQAFYKQKQAEYDAAEKKARQLYADNKKTTQWGEVAELLGHAVAKLGAGAYGLRHNVDMSGVKFDKSNWADDYNRLLAELNSQLESVEKGRNRLSKEQEREEDKLSRQGERAEDFLNSDYMAQERRKQEEENQARRDAREDKRLAQQERIADAKQALADKKQETKDAKEQQEISDGRYPIKPGVKLSGENMKRYDSAVMGLEAAKGMEAALKSGDNTFSLVGDNDFTLNKNRFTEALGRMQSGGAISKEEEKRFAHMAPTFTDSAEIQQKKIQWIKDEMAKRLKTLGAEVPEKETSPATSKSKPKTVIQNGHTYKLNEETGEYE